MKNSKVLQRDEIMEVLEQLSESRRATDSLEALIWTGLGLILVLLYAFLLTTHWFS